MSMLRAAISAVLAAGVILIAGCTAVPVGHPVPAATSAVPPTTRPESASQRVPFPAAAAFDYQLGGAYEPPPGVTVVVRDSLETPAPGRYSICYVNGFQTQPGVVWPDTLILRSADGTPVRDPNWPDENILDISSPATRADAAVRQFATIDRCAAAGFAAVEFDNLDSYTRSQNRFGLVEAIAFATTLVEHAHALGLSAGQKNTGELGTRGRDQIGFDFAVVEECDRFAECAAFRAVYGDRVLDIEYGDNLRRAFAKVCADPATPASTILRDRKLVPAGAPGYLYQRC